ncbi:protein-disulfide reductase DsbD domain-containing protein [Aliidiomarina taiwanensis]|nr:protein-disulfide reductase DsbD domain-containing protein [Aliidiomarina taiwanensis]
MQVFLRSMVFTLFLGVFSSSSLAALQSPFGDAIQGNKYPPSEQVFVIDYNQVDAELRVRFSIRDGFYLYQHRFDFSPEEKVHRVHPLPEGELHSDEFFGDTVIYRDHVELVVDLNAARRNEILNVHLQGCADEGFCYPPTTQQIFLRRTAGTSDDTAALASSPAPEPLQASKSQTTSVFLWGLFILAGLALLAVLLRRRKK